VSVFCYFLEDTANNKGIIITKVVKTDGLNSQ